MNTNEETDMKRTEALVARLAVEVEQARPTDPAFSPVFLFGMLAATLAAFVVVTFVVGYRPDLDLIWPTWTFLFKLAVMGLAAGGAMLAVYRAGIPGLSIRPAIVLAPAAVLLIAGAILDGTGFPVLGRQMLSVPKCVGSIVLAALPALAAIVLALRRGIPTNLQGAGAMAGLLAGSLGALAYALACVNDGPAFVALWYSVAIALTTAIGALLGRRMLAW